MPETTTSTSLDEQLTQKSEQPTEEKTNSTSLDYQTQTISPNEQSPTISPLDQQLSQKREELTQAQITQTNAYSDYMKVMKAKTIVDEKDTEKVAKLDKLMFEHFITYQHALEEVQKLQVELSDLESQKYLEELLA